VIAGPVKSKRSASNRRVYRVGDQRIAGCVANALPDPIAQSNHEHLGRRPRERNERSHRRRQRIAEYDERLSALNPVRPPSAHQLEDR
jgi:hypothetical protein